MKIPKLMTIDEEIIQKLKQEPNASALVERLLKEYYAFGGDKKKNQMIQREILLKNYSKTVKNLKKEMKIMKQVESLGADQFAIRWLRAHEIKPGHYETSAYRRNRNLQATTENLLKAWEVINNNVQLFEKI